MPGPPIEMVKNLQISDKNYGYEPSPLSRKYTSQTGSNKSYQPLSPKHPRNEEATPRQRRYETPTLDKNLPDVNRRNEFNGPPISLSSGPPVRHIQQQRQSLIQLQQQQQQYQISNTNNRPKLGDQSQVQKYRPEEFVGHRIEIGLENLGNTCFMNSMLQCLLHIQPLTSYFLEGRMENDLNPQSPKKGMLATSFFHLVRDIFHGKAGATIAPVNFQRAVGIFAPYLMDFQQQDSQEFLRFLLDGMSEDLCRRKPDPPTNTKSSNQISPPPPVLTPVRSKSNSILPVLPQSSKSPDRTTAESLTPQGREKVSSIQKLRNETRAMRDASLAALTTDSQDDSKITTDNTTIISSSEVPQSKLRLVKDIQRSRKQQSTLSSATSSQEPNHHSDTEEERSESVPNSARSKSTFSHVKDVLSGKTLRSLRKNKTPSGELITAQDPNSSTNTESARERRGSEGSGATKVSVESPDDPIVIEKAAMKAWDGYLKLNDSIITDIFGGLLHSTIQCTHCSYRSHTFDPFLDLSVPISRETDSNSRGLFSGIRQISGDNKSTLEKCLDKFTGEEILDADNMYKCEKCKKNRKCTKRLQIYRYPKVLVIHIKRFRFNSTTREKLSTDVHFPLTGLDLRPYLSSDLQSLLLLKAKPAPTNTNQQDDQSGILTSATVRMQSQNSLVDSPEPSNTDKLAQTDGALITRGITAATASSSLVPLENNLALSQLLCNSTIAPIYDLIGVSNHHGTLNGGHYIAHVDTTYGNSKGESPRWMCFNDARVTQANVNSISGPTAYVLFYKLREGEVAKLS